MRWFSQKRRDAVPCSRLFSHFAIIGLYAVALNNREIREHARTENKLERNGEKLRLCAPERHDGAADGTTVGNGAMRPRLENSPGRKSTPVASKNASTVGAGVPGIPQYIAPD
jgi:hypothetical protein